MRPARPALLAVLLSLAALPATAEAVLVAPGSTDGRVAIAPDGTAFVAYTTNSGDALGLCRLPYRATACEPVAVPPQPNRVAADGYDSGPAEVNGVELLRRPADGALVLVTATFDSDSGVDPDGRQTYATVSPDNGATWSPQVQIGSGQGQLSQATLTPDGAAVNVLGGEPGAAQFSRLPLVGPAVGVLRDLNPDPTPGGEIVTEQTLTTEANGAVIIGFRYQSRFGLTRLAAGADPVAGWTPWKRAGRIKADEVEQRLVTGPRGTFLLSRRNIITQIKSRYRALFFRKVGPTRVAKGTPIGRGFTNNAVDLAQDTLGGHHLAWFNRDGRPEGIYYMRSRGAKGRCSIGGQTAQVRITYSQLEGAPRIAAATPRRAAIVYEDGAGVQVTFARGGDRPRLSRAERRRCG